MTSRNKDKKPDFGSAARPVAAGTPVLRFRIELPLEEEERNVLVWRTIEVPQDYTFWDLHVAIQDAMGWADYHLHEFIVPSNEGGQGTLKLGIPGLGDFPALEPGDGSKVALTGHQKAIAGRGMVYLYDFGDDWRHRVTLEAVIASDGGMYPRCLAGENACPPEDCGGESGYFRVLDILKNRSDPEHRDTKNWLRHHTNATWPYRPDAFSPERVHFDDAAKRLAYAMTSGR